MYRRFILDLFSVLGVAFLVSALWKNIEIALYGFTQPSIVDTFFGVFFSVVVVAALKVSDVWIEGEEEEDEDDG